MSNNNSEQMVMSGTNAILSERYAGVLLELADEKGLIDDVSNDVEKLFAVWNESGDFREIASDPRLDANNIKRIVENLSKALELNDLTKRFLLAAAHNHRLNIIPAFVQKFREELSTKRGEFSAKVCVASALSDSQYKKLADKLSSVLNGKVNLFVKEDPEILGGMTVQVGSQLFDASVKTQLAHMERSLM